MHAVFNILWIGNSACYAQVTHWFLQISVDPAEYYIISCQHQHSWQLDAMLRHQRFAIWFVLG